MQSLPPTLSNVSAPARPNRRWAWLIFLALGLVVALAPLPYPVRPVERHYRLEARSFEYLPATLYANPGDRVTVEIVSTDVVHGFLLDGHDVIVTAEPGKTATATFTAERPGVFRFRCPVACGQLHPFMTGKLQVGPNLLMWRAAALGILVVASVLWTLR